MGAHPKRLTHPWPVVRATKLTPTWPPVDATRRPPPWPVARATRCLVRATKARTAQARLLQPRSMVRRGHSVRACRSPPWMAMYGRGLVKSKACTRNALVHTNHGPKPGLAYTNKIREQGSLTPFACLESSTRLNKTLALFACLKPARTLIETVKRPPRKAPLITIKEIMKNHEKSSNINKRL